MSIFAGAHAIGRAFLLPFCWLPCLRPPAQRVRRNFRSAPRPGVGQVNTVGEILGIVWNGRFEIDKHHAGSIAEGTCGCRERICNCAEPDGRIRRKPECTVKHGVPLCQGGLVA